MRPTEDRDPDFLQAGHFLRHVLSLDCQMRTEWGPNSRRGESLLLHGLNQLQAYVDERQKSVRLLFLRIRVPVGKRESQLVDIELDGPVQITDLQCGVIIGMHWRIPSFAGHR